MKELEIIETRDTPYVRFSLEEGCCEINGKSFPPDVTKFFSPLESWVEKLKDISFEKMTLKIVLDYYNTASSKMILNILYLFEDLYAEKKNVKVEWYYPVDDEDMLDAGEEFEGLVNVPFEHIEYEKEY